MRLTACFAIFALASPSLALAQRPVPVERRIDSLEKQMRSVQRRVFQPGSAGAAEADMPAPVAPNGNGLPLLTQRIDALERQLAVMTGEVEENGNRIRTLEEDVRRLRDARSERAESTAAPAPAPTPAATAAVEPEAALTAVAPEQDPPSADPAENDYLAGYRFWEAKNYDEAETRLKSTAAKYPKHRRASWARNLLGRTYLDDNKPATAAEAFLSNYQELPQGERAADSLYFLGAALMKLKKPEQACKVYDELADVYGGTMRDFLKQNLPAARKQAKCSS